MAIGRVLNFFENLADLHAQGYLSWSEIDDSWGEALIDWWGLMGDTVMSTRQTSLERRAGN